MAEKKKTWPGYTKEAHPEVCDIRAMPPQPKVLKPGQLPEEQIRQYFEEVSYTQWTGHTSHISFEGKSTENQTGKRNICLI